ncbi:endonuclease V [Natrialba sp. INN-245]|uniref:endonuclease V n=1 Tax=Natrialba sp. INN-245 TaxID=2690967 RepID=UPI001310EFCF|nr:endonuclease V [Natrialba sp. INN-245]MWV39270.1 endonuclease V [Natrialba sp. INN-245]
MTTSHDPRPDLAPQADLSREEMESLQREIADAAIFEDSLEFESDALSSPLEAAAAGAETPIVAGVDQSFLLDSEPERALSAVVAMRGGEVIERVHAVTPLEIPYVPGLLAFREGGPILAALEELSVDPDCYLFDGSGRIHFRQAGIATHVGVVLDAPSVGVAKSLLCGKPREDLENRQPGVRVPIEANGRVDALEGTVLGYAVQTRQYDSPNRSINPLYVSPGHRVSAETAADVAFDLATSYKLPEPIRLADAYADEAKRERRRT